MGNLIGYCALGSIGYGAGSLMGFWGGDIGPDEQVTCACKEGVLKVCGPLHVRHVAADKTKYHSVVFLHGMWHGPWYFEYLMQELRKEGVPSFAVDLEQMPFKTQYGKRGFVSQVDDTLRNLGVEEDPVVIVGHSQGGVLAQMLLRDKPQYFCGAALVATAPLSSGKLVVQEVRKAGPPGTDVFREMGILGSLYFTFTGRIYDHNVIRNLFLLPDTKEITNIVPGGIQQYYDKLMRAPCDGWPTQLHWWQGSPCFKHLGNIPILLVFAEKDVIYPHSLLRPGFQAYFPQAKEMLVKNQAHCLVDPGWEDSYAKPFVKELVQMAKRQPK